MPINDPEKSENMRKSIRVYSGSSNRPLAQKIAEYLGVELSGLTLKQFANGEIYARYDETVRGADVFLIQSVAGGNVNDMLMELLIATDAAKRASARSITAVITHYGYARQDRKDKPRVSIAAKLVSDMLVTAGVDRVITMDLHADQIQGFFNVPVDHLYASSVFIPYIQSLNLEDLVIATPDVGGAKRANSYAKYLDVPLVLCHKQRAKANVVAKMTVIGEVEGKNVILVDDMVDTAGTITKAADLMMANGAKSVRALCTHAIMSEPATQRVEDCALVEMIFTNSIPYNKNCSIISVARLFADTIRRVHSNESISSQYLIK